MRQHKAIKCNMCGHCCRVIVNIIPYSNDSAEWAVKRGYKLLMTSEKFLAIEIPSVCPQLTDDNKCKLQEAKPQVCMDYPAFLNESDFKLIGIGRDDILGKSCGYRHRK